MLERRKYERTPTSIRVEITHPAFGTLVGFTRDISDGGAQVGLESTPVPPVGTVVSVKFHKIVGPINLEPVEMKIVHCNRNVIGLMFMPR
ncbi:PilZ domain-containing protein [Teredinibacter turnerae]|uniref:Type IV pilus assembly protein PilZ n=1 Tax=Teredinibacter turnerae (strain ATCC 39867 / T7901) TaxID=377629 RepID=C5BQD4_TERTT|nr:PilZ domain-containing protein [Teredinibacter turnerae]ACR13545.1 Type IV pilus assembly protein PilZ [Teredinibacter turnerae T7901]